MSGRRGSGAGRGGRPDEGGSRPWWCRTGSEDCAACLGTFDLEVEVRCHDCDSPVCPFCVVEIEATTTLHCVDCSPGGP